MRLLKLADLCLLKVGIDLVSQVFLPLHSGACRNAWAAWWLCCRSGKAQRMAWGQVVRAISHDFQSSLGWLNLNESINECFLMLQCSSFLPLVQQTTVDASSQ